MASSEITKLLFMVFRRRAKGAVTDAPLLKVRAWDRGLQGPCPRLSDDNSMVD